MARKLIIVKDPNLITPNMFESRTRMFVKDFNNTAVDLAVDGSAFDFSNNLKLAGLFLKLHPQGYKALWVEDTVEYHEVNPDILK